MTDQILINLSPTENEKLEAEIAAEIAAIPGGEPTLAAIKNDMSEDKRLRETINGLHGLGRVVEILIRESVSSLGALLLLIGFTILEAERIYTGMSELGQSDLAARILAGGLVLANITLPIYRLRRQRTGESLKAQRWTLRSKARDLWGKLADPRGEIELDPNHNPTLHIAEQAILTGTLFLAFMAVAGPTMEQYADLTWYTAIWRSVGGTFGEFVPMMISFLVSIGGVFMLQSVSHEVAVRAIQERPPQERDVLAAKQSVYAARVEAIRRETRARYMAAKVADKNRKAQKDLEKERINAQAPKATVADSSAQSDNETAHVAHDPAQELVIVPTAESPYPKNPGSVENIVPVPPAVKQPSGNGHGPKMSQ